MGHTITEKILARVSGREHVKAGDEIMAKPDFVIAYDFPGYTDVYFKSMKEDFGIQKVAEPERYAIFIDHMVPAATPKEEELHIGTRDMVRGQQRCPCSSGAASATRWRPRSATRCPAPSSCISTGISASSALSARWRWAFAATCSRPSCANASR